MLYLPLRPAPVDVSSPTFTMIEVKKGQFGR